MAFDLFHENSYPLDGISDVDDTFCLRQATQAVIFRVMSGGLRSPKDSRKALTAGGEGIEASILNTMCTFESCSRFAVLKSTSTSDVHPESTVRVKETLRRQADKPK